MPRGVWAYIAILVSASWVLGLAAWFVQQQLDDDKKQWAGFIYVPLLFIPLISVAILHRRQASAGNPYMGLVWGATSWYWLLYFGLLAYGAFVAGVLVVMGGASFDPSMGGYVERVAAMSAEQGNPIPESGKEMLKISGWFTAVGVPLLGPWFGTAFACIASFPQLGWLTRRLLTRGRTTAFAILALLAVLAAAPAGLIENPQQLDVDSMPLRMMLIALSGLAGLPLMLWVFYRTRSVVLATLSAQSYASGFTALMPFLADGPSWLLSPQGLAVSLGSLLLGIALWVWKDPGGQELAVAAVAPDGTPLSPQMVAETQAYQARLEGA